MKEFQVIADDVLLPPDEINAIYGDINNVLQINVNCMFLSCHVRVSE